MIIKNKITITTRNLIPVMDGIPVVISRLPIVRWIRVDEEHFKDWISKTEFIRGVKYDYIVELDSEKLDTDYAKLRLSEAEAKKFIPQYPNNIQKTTRD